MGSKRPAILFYTGDWLKDAALRSCSMEARSLWIDMICIMHEGTPYGHLKVNNKVIDAGTLSRMTGGEGEEKTRGMLGELFEAGVYRLTEENVIYSPRMLRDEELRKARSDGGKNGGNPKLGISYNKKGYVYAMLRTDGQVKIGISVNPHKRIYKIREQYPNQTIDILATKLVEDMGAEESKYHKMFAKKQNGEWFDLSQKEKEKLLSHLNSLKGESQGVLDNDNERDNDNESLNGNNPTTPIVEKIEITMPFPSEDFSAAWTMWKGYKKKQFSFTYKTPESEQAALIELSEFSGGIENTALLIIRQSVANGWQGLFKLKSDRNGQSQQGNSGFKPATGGNVSSAAAFAAIDRMPDPT